MHFKKLSQYLLTLSRPAKRGLAVGFDTVLCVVAVWLSFNLRQGFWAGWSPAHNTVLLVCLAMALPLFTVQGFYRAIFRYAGLPALMTVLKASAILSVVLVLVFAVVSVPGVPRAIGVLLPLLLMVMVMLSRLVVRYWLGGMYQSAALRLSLPRVLIYGAGSAGRQLAAALKTSPEVVVVGYLDDDERLHGHVLDGHKIFNPEALVAVTKRLHVTQVYLAIPSATRARRNEVLELVRAAQVQVRTLPGLLDLAEGRVQVSDLKELDIEDLLGRDPVPPNPLMLAKNITGKVVMVTGAGGSIGSELCRQIAWAQPATLLLVELTEFALYAIEHELQNTILDDSASDVRLVPLLANVRDAARMDQILRAWRPDTVYHAAAYKHVPLVEHNPAEGIKNNVLGTLTTARLAAVHGVRDFVLISTDKAVRPTNVMGGSKRLAEMVLQALATAGTDRMGASVSTKFSMVRFGNVLGSSGSVVPLFREQIKNGGPITLTHEDVTRYFMTISEAASLVLIAGGLSSSRGPHEGDLFVLDMGKPIRIRDLAERMIRAAGHTVKSADQPNGDIEIAVVGLRPGEKLHEELLIEAGMLTTPHTKILRAQERGLSTLEMASALQELRTAVAVGDAKAARNVVATYVEGYGGSVEAVLLRG